MKKNLILALLLTVSNTTFVQAANPVEKQTWEFYSTVKTPTIEEMANTDNFKFGKEAGYLYTRFMDVYVVREEVVAGDPTQRTIIRKPAIYNAVRTVEKQLRRDLKDDKLTIGKVAMIFNQVLKVALSAIDSESETFEEALQDSRRDANNLLDIFNSVRLTEI